MIAGITIGAAAAAIIGGIVGAVVSYGLSAAFGLNRSPKAQSSATSNAAAADSKQTIRQSVSPRRVIYGQARVGGTLVYVGSSGADQSQLWMVIVLAGHKCAGVDAFWINDDLISRSDMSGATVVSGKYAGKVSLASYLGFQTTGDAGLIANSPDGWSADHKLLGCTYLVAYLEYDRDIFTGVPTITALVRGRCEIYDPRDASVQYTDNWALCVRDYLVSDFGMACAADEIDDASFIAAANLSDEAVPLNADGTVTQPRYRIGGTFTLDEKPIDIVDGLMAAGAGALPYIQGTYRLYGGAYTAPSASLDLSDAAGSLQVVTRPPRAEMFNTLGGTFIDPERFYQASEFGVMQDAAALSEDGAEQRKDVDFAFITDRTRAQRLARQMLLRSRNPIIVKWKLRYEWIRLCAWQVVSLTVPDFGWSAKAFRITAFSFDPSSGDVSVSMQEEVASTYAWLYDQLVPAGDNPDSTLISPLDIPAPTGLAVTPTTVLQGDGGVAPALEVTWTAVPHAFVRAHEVQWRVSAGPGPYHSLEVAVPTARAVLAPVIVGVGYDVRVRGVTELARGAWTGTVGATGAPDTTAPGSPTSPSVVGTLRGFSLRWTNPTDSDLARTDIFESTGGSYVKVGESRSDFAVLSGYSPGDVRYFIVQSVDRTGNRSSLVYAGGATIPQANTNDIGSGEITTTAGIKQYAASSSSRPGSGYYTAGLTGVVLTVGGDGKVIVNMKAPHFTFTTASGSGGNTGGEGLSGGGAGGGGE